MSIYNTINKNKSIKAQSLIADKAIKARIEASKLKDEEDKKNLSNLEYLLKKAQKSKRIEDLVAYEQAKIEANPQDFPREYASIQADKVRDAKLEQHWAKLEAERYEKYSNGINGGNQ